MFVFQVDYITMPGWETSTENVREYSDLPENAKKYIEKIEDLLDVPGLCLNYYLIIIHLFL